MPMVKGAPIYGTYGGYYDHDEESGSTWVADGPGQWVQDGDGENYWVGDRYIIGYEPDVFVPDTPTTSTPTTSTPTTSTPTTSTPTPTPKGDPIYGTEPRPEETEGDDENPGGYDYGTYTTGYFSDPDSGTGSRDWIGDPTDEIIGYNPTAPDTTGTTTAPITSTPIVETPSPTGFLGQVLPQLSSEALETPGDLDTALNLEKALGVAPITSTPIVETPSPAGTYVQGAPIYGTYGGRYEETGDGEQTWVPDGPGQWVQDEDGENYWAGDEYVTGYGSDVFVPSTPVADTPVVETPVVETPVADTPVVETPVADTPVAEPIDLGLDIPDLPATSTSPVDPTYPTENLGVGVGSDPLGLNIPTAPTYYQEYVPPQQPVVPQLTQAELIQLIANQAPTYPQAFQDGGLATPTQNQGIASLQNRIQKQQVRSPLSSGIGGQGAVLGSFR